MGVDHSGLHVLVAEQLLYGADVVAGLEQVRGEAMAEGVGADGLGETGFAAGGPHGFLQRGFMGVVAPQLAAPGILRNPFRRKDILPADLLSRARVFSLQRVWQIGFAESFLEVLVVDHLDFVDLVS